VISQSEAYIMLINDNINFEKQLQVKIPEVYKMSAKFKSAPGIEVLIAPFKVLTKLSSDGKIRR